MANNLTYTINLKVNDAALKGLITALGTYNSAAGNAGKATASVEKQLAALDADARKAAGGVNAANKALDATAASAASASKAAGGVDDAFQGIANTRYAMYDVATSLGVVSAATLGLSIAAIKTAADYEALFASVQRTSQTSGEQWSSLRDSLLDITTEMPVTVDSITTIATLGGQLGIQAQNIDAFTESTAKFAATTDVSAQAAAEGFGRLAQLSGAGQDSFDKLEASVYQVGVTSVATESAVLGVATQISVSARQAGFAADQTIALAGALASLGVAPERARGSIQRVFNIITNAADNGGDKLEQFARTAGVTAEEFAATWKGDPQTAFQEFLAGLGEADAAGQNMNNILASVGISAVRDTDALKRLAQNTDVYADSIAQANDGWNDGSVFAKGYAVQTANLNAKMQVLAQTIKAVIASAQDNTVLKFLVDLLQAFATTLKNLSGNLGGKIFLTLATGLGLVVGGLAAFGAGSALAAASMLALLTVVRQLTSEQNRGTTTFGLARLALVEYAAAMGRATQADLDKILTTNATTTAMQRMGATLRVVNATTRATSIALKGLLASTILGAAFVGLGLIFEKFTGDADKAKQAKEDLDASFKEAIGIDVKAYQEAGGVLKEIPASIDAAGASSAAASTEAQGLAASFVGLNTDAGTAGAGVQGVTDKLYDLTDALGDATDAAIDKSIMDTILGPDDGNQLARVQNTIAGFKAMGITMEDLRNKIKGNDQDFFKKLAGDSELASGALEGLANSSVRGRAVIAEYPGLTIASAQALEGFGRSAVTAGQALADQTDAAAAASLVQQALGFSLDSTDDDQNDAAQSAIDLSNGLFDSSNAAIGMTNAMYGLASQVSGANVGFDTLTQDGAANMSAFQGAVAAAAKLAGDDSDLFISLVDNIIQQMVAAGVTGVNELIKVRNQYATITGGIPNANTDLQASAYLSGQFADGMHRAAAATNDVADNARKAQKEIRTLTDYVSDLSSVMKAAFDYRFGFSQAKDDATQALRKIQDGLADAARDVRDLIVDIQELNATLQGLGSEKSTLEYQLQIALLYGDTLGAQDLQAKIAANAAATAKAQDDLADKQGDLTKAQEDATPTLTGNTDAAIAQREAVLALVQATEDKIVAYAADGHSQKEVIAYAKKVKAQLAAQLTQLGYNTNEVETYTASLDDLVTILKAVPRDLTVKVDANTSPAQKALDEFFSKNKDKSITTNHKVNTQYVSTGHPPSKEQIWLQNIASQIAAITAQIRYWSGVKGNNTGILAGLGQELTRLQKIQTKGFSDGGWTGPGGKHAPKGVVHGNEYVVESERVNKLGVPFLNALGTSTERGYSGGGPVNVSAHIPGSMMVELSPTDRRLLANAGVGDVYIDSKKVTDAVNSRNAVTGARGIQ